MLNTGQIPGMDAYWDFLNYCSKCLENLMRCSLKHAVLNYCLEKERIVFCRYIKRYLRSVTRQVTSSILIHSQPFTNLLSGIRKLLPSSINWYQRIFPIYHLVIERWSMRKGLETQKHCKIPSFILLIKFIITTILITTTSSSGRMYTCFEFYKRAQKTEIFQRAEY